MSKRDDEKKKKTQGNPSSGRPATKFMERPKPGESKEPSSSVDPWAADDQDTEDTDDVGAHPEIPTEGKQGKPGKPQVKPGWEKEDEEKEKEGTLGEEDDEGDRE